MKTREDVRAALRRWGSTIKYCERKKKLLSVYDEQIAAFRELRVKALNGMPRGNDVGDPTGETAAHIEAMMERYKEKAGEVSLAIQDALEFKTSMDGIIDGLPDIQQQVLDCRYVKELSWIAIAMNTHVSESHAKKHESDAIDEILKVNTF